MRRILPLTASVGALVVLAAPAALAVPSPTAPNEVVYVSDANNDGVSGVVVRNLTTRTAAVVLPEDAQNEYFYDSPELSPDGASIALSTDRGNEGGELSLAIVARNSKTVRRLTTPASTDTTDTIDLLPRYSPNGDRILFTRLTITYTGDNPDDFTAASQLYTVPTAVPSSGAPVITKVPGTVRGFTGDWNVDGSKIVYTSLAATSAPGTDPDTGTLTVVNSDGTGTATDLVVKGSSPTWSPDGTSIAYSTITNRSAKGVTSKLAIIAPDGTGNRVLNMTQPSSAPSLADSPAWTPDSQSLLYSLNGYNTAGFPGPADIYAIDRAGIRAGKVIAGAGDERQPFVGGPTPAVVDEGDQSSFTPVTPKRILDTRKSIGGPTAKVGAGATLALQVTGVTTSAGDVPADATAVVLNVTAVQPTAGTDVRVYANGADAPSASNVNAARGAITPNLVTVRVGTDGKVVLKNTAGQVDLVADIAGYYRPTVAVGNTGVGFAPVTPGRILDTRRGFRAGPAKVGQAPLTVKVTGTLPISTGGTVAVPEDAAAVVLNVTSTQSTKSTDVRVYPTPTDTSTDAPEVSNLNVRAGKDTANLVTVAVGANGTVQMLNLNGDTHLVADIAGYYGGTGANAGTNQFTPVDPARFLDTRSGTGTAPIPATKSGFVQLDVGGSRGVPEAAVAAVVNLTGTGTTGNTDVRAYPVGIGGTPLVSNLNLAKGETRANLAIVQLGTGGELQVLNRDNSVNLIGDLAGYMAPPA